MFDEITGLGGIDELSSPSGGNRGSGLGRMEVSGLRGCGRVWRCRDFTSCPLCLVEGRCHLMEG